VLEIHSSTAENKTGDVTKRTCFNAVKGGPKAGHQFANSQRDATVLFCRQFCQMSRVDRFSELFPPQTLQR